MVNLIRLTRISTTPGVAPGETLINPDSISTVEALQVGDRYVLMIQNRESKSLMRYAAVDSNGDNTIDEPSAEAVLSNFRQYVSSAS
ncbi:hypothetical protein BAURA63_03515 [Brevibacterium aurantiacum]|uniref:Uncharacterized protein n=1 Tax=Brevibacterium aurantiacum TaxID=273384 RepID=A0A2H1KN05_BREAU|nr:hypothetical protein BAURA63_03515 [Brevibacterium aurantiacum]